MVKSEEPDLAADNDIKPPTHENTPPTSPKDASPPTEVIPTEDLGPVSMRFGDLVRCGAFGAAVDLYTTSLQPHKHMFSVFAEYFDFLLQQGDYNSLDIELAWYAEAHLTLEAPLDENQLWVLRLADGLTRLHTEGNLLMALEVAREWHAQARDRVQDYSAVEMHALEIYLDIIVFACCTSTWVQTNDTNPPWYNASQSWEGFVDLACALYHQGRLEESLRFTRQLMYVLDEHHAQNLFFTFMKLFSRSHALATDDDERERYNLAQLDLLAAYCRSLAPPVNDGLVLRRISTITQLVTNMPHALTEQICTTSRMICDDDFTQKVSRPLKECILVLSSSEHLFPGMALHSRLAILNKLRYICHPDRDDDVNMDKQCLLVLCSLFDKWIPPLGPILPLSLPDLSQDVLKGDEVAELEIRSRLLFRFRTLRQQYNLYGPHVGDYLPGLERTIRSRWRPASALNIPALLDLYNQAVPVVERSLWSNIVRRRHGA